MPKSNAVKVWELFSTYAGCRRDGRSHPEAERAVRDTAADYDPAQITASVEFGAAVHWLGDGRKRSVSDLVAKWRAAGSPV